MFTPASQLNEMIHKSNIICGSGLALLLTLLGAAGCSKGSAPEALFDPVVRVAPEVAPPTKGSYTTDNLKEFDLFINNHGNSKYSYTNTKFTKNSETGEWEPAKTMLWEGKKTKFDFLAVAPSQAAGLSMTDDPVLAFEVETEQTKGSTASDLLLAYKSGTSCEDTELFDEGKMKIAFNHALSLLKVQFTLGTEFNHSGVPQSNPISDVKIGKFKTMTGIRWNNNKFDAVWPSGDVKTVQAYEESWTKAVDEAGKDDKTKNCVAVFECIVVPQNWTEFTVNFVLGGKPYTYTANSAGNGLFESGKSYTLPLTVGKDEVISGNITASPWEPGNGEGESMETD